MSRPLSRCLPKLVGGSDPQHPADLRGSLGAEAQQPSEADKLWRDCALELCELGDLARLDELAELPLDASPDAPELASPARADEPGDRRRGSSDESSRAAVCTHAIWVRPRQVEKCCERLEPIGELRVLEVVRRAHVTLPGAVGVTHPSDTRNRFR